MPQTVESDDQLRYERERTLHDARFAGGARKASKYYVINRACTECYADGVHLSAEERRALEYGCGTGSAAFDLADGTATVVGIDLSGEAVDQASGAAAARGVDARFLQMNAERLGFADGSFDLVCGSGILHHLDLRRATTEVARVLRPGGRAVFLEPLGHNPLVNLYRRVTPGMRTPDEHPLLVRDLESFSSDFADVSVSYFALVSLFALPLRGWSRFDAALGLLERADRWLFAHVPWIRRYAWTVVLEFSAPRGKHDDG